MEGLTFSKESVLSAMLEARHTLTDTANKVMEGPSAAKENFMTAIDLYEKCLKEYLRLGVE